MKRAKDGRMGGSLGRLGAGLLLTGLSVGLATGLGGCARSISQVRADANAHHFDGRYLEAQPLYEEVAQRKPGEAKANYELGRNLLALGRAAEARERMILAYNLEPSNETYFEGMAEAFAASGDEEGLFRALEHRIRDRGDVGDYLMLGRFAERVGHADEAERAYLSAAEIAGTETPEAQRALAAFYRRVGDRDNEIRRLRMLLWFDARDAEVETRLRELGQIPGPTFALTPRGR